MKDVWRLKVRDRVSEAFLAILRDYPQSSFNDIFEVVDSLRPTGAGERGSEESAPPARKATAEAKKAPKSPATGNLRTREGREAYEARVLAILTELGGKEVPARSIGHKAGGNQVQVRTALKSLVERGTISVSGQKAGTKYSIVQRESAAP
ncbi:MAG: hypothetical protein HY791_15985 [Deltaproteobacteria bacterium]|nr:hypothetical protein [Deltaproteobacteria bacterium]